MRAPAPRLALIVAPPGYGKSTLIGEWADADDREFLWPAPTSDLSALAQLIRAARARRHGFVVVLDPIDDIDAADVAEMVAAGLAELPVGSTIALASRTEPDFPLGRLRTHRLVAEVGLRDLSMSAAEATALFRRERLELPLEDVETLVRRTEGWPAALSLSALALREPGVDAASFGGGHHLMYQYLDDEVLAGLPSRLKDFAVRSSVLHELSGPVCDAVLELRGSARLLAEMARGSTLLMAVEGARHRYRWHPLMRDALLSELQHVEPELERQLQRRASHWYADAGQTQLAIDHAAAAGEAELAGDLLSESILCYLTQGRNRRVTAWLSALGEERIADYAPLALCASLSCLTAGNLHDAQRWSAAAGAALKRGRAGRSPRSLTDRLALVQAFAGTAGLTSMGQVAAGTACAEPDDSQWKPLCLLLEGISSHLQGDRVAAVSALDKAIDHSTDPAPTLKSITLAQRSMIALEAKDWELAAELTDRAMWDIDGWAFDREPITAIVFAAAAAARARDGRVDDAKANLRLGIDLMAALGDFLPWYAAETRMLLAHASLSLADVVGARTLLAEASRMARRVPDAVIFAEWFAEAWAHMDTLAETSLAGPSSLTIAELRILRFLPSHRSFREIAAQLNVSANTVKTQAHAVYRKLGAASRSEAVARALEAGLLGQ